MKTSQLRNQNIRATFRRHWPWLLLMVLMLCTTGFARALGADMTSLIVKRLQNSGEALWSLIFLVSLVQLVNYGTKFVSAYSCTALQKKLEVSLRVQVLHTLQHIPFARFEGMDPGTAQTILRKDVEGAASYLYVVFSRIGVSVTTLVFTVYFMLRVDPWMTCILLTIAVGLGFLNRKVLARLKKLNLEAKRLTGSLSQIAANTLETRDTVKVYQAETFVEGRFLEERERLNDAQIKVEKTDGIRVGIYTVVNNLILYSSAILLACWAIAGRNELGQVVAYISLATQALVAIEMIFRWMASVVNCNAAWERVGSILRLPAEKPEEKEGPCGPIQSLAAEGLGFAYESSQWVFRELDFSVSKGEILEIAGQSGSGKSTLFKCLMGLYTPEEGSIRVNGQPFTGEAFLGRVGFVPAQYVFYAGTVYDNLTLGDSSISREVCLQNAERLGIRLWLEKMGLDYPLKENAGNLSGGQKQILSVLRAVNFDAPVLILDEPFASLDTERRKQLSDFLYVYRQDHIVILTSHIDREEMAGVKRCFIHA